MTRARGQEAVVVTESFVAETALQETDFGESSQLYSSIYSPREPGDKPLFALSGGLLS